MERLKTEADLQPLLAQYVPLELKVKDPDFSVWVNQYRPSANGIPMIFIVSATGEEIYNKSGAPAGDGLKKLLEMGIQAAGVPEKEEEAAPEVAAGGSAISRDFMRAARRASLLVLRKKPSMAIDAMAPHFDQLEQLKESNHSSARTFVRIMEDLTSEGSAELEAARTKLGTKGQGYFGLLALVRTNRIYGKLPALAEGIQEEMDAIAADERKAPFIAHAELIDEGRQLEDEGKKADAIETYKLVISRYPETFSAKLCQKKLSQLEGELLASRSADAADGAVSEAARKEAAIQLIRAKAFARYSPDKAREYAQKVVEMVPGTSVAKQAEEVLNSLP
jgi:hypothetical protein